MNREVFWRGKRAENTVLAQHTMDTQKNSVKLQRWPLLLVPCLPFVYEIRICGSKWHLNFTTQIYNSLCAFHALHMHHTILSECFPAQCLTQKTIMTINALGTILSCFAAPTPSLSQSERGERRRIFGVFGALVLLCRHAFVYGSHGRYTVFEVEFWV